MWALHPLSAEVGPSLGSGPAGAGMGRGDWGFPSWPRISTSLEKKKTCVRHNAYDDHNEKKSAGFFEFACLFIYIMTLMCC